MSFPEVAFAGCRRVMLSSLVVVLIISVFQFWLMSNGKVEAIRIHRENKWAVHNEDDNKKNVNEKEQLFNKLFNGGALEFNATQKSFEETKRRVPSCPDALHNK